MPREGLATDSRGIPCRAHLQEAKTPLSKRAEQLSRNITIHNIQEVFFQMEETEDLFNLQGGDGTYFWDIVRRDVYLRLHTMHGGPFVDSPMLSDPSLLTLVKDAVKPLINRLTRHYLETRAPQYIFITGQRTRLGGGLVDNISDHLFELMFNDAVAVELMNKAAISYRKMLFGRRTRVPPVAVRRNRIQQDLPRFVATISAVVRKHFDTSIDAHDVILGPIMTFRENKDFYLQLFARYRPKAVVCINNGTLSGLFSAGKEMRVPLLELQHGGSNYRTIFWSYPKSIPVSHPGLILPTAYLTFSDFWNGNTHFPVSVTRSIGNDYFCRKSTAGDENGVLFISSYMHHESLLNLALELSDVVKDRKLYYKLHPHQFDQKAEVVAACRGKSNIVIVSDDLEFPELFNLCNYVVGVHSTALYIALQAGKKVCVYKRSIYFWHEDVFEYVELFDSVSELRDVFDSPPGKYFRNLGNLPVLFQPFDAKQFLRALEDANSHA
jgi:hypothetical protein